MIPLILSLYHLHHIIQPITQTLWNTLTDIFNTFFFTQTWQSEVLFVCLNLSTVVDWPIFNIKCIRLSTLSTEHRHFCSVVHIRFSHINRTNVALGTIVAILVHTTVWLLVVILLNHSRAAVLVSLQHVTSCINHWSYWAKYLL